MMRPRELTDPEIAWCNENGEFPAATDREVRYAEDVYAFENFGAKRTDALRTLVRTRADEAPATEVQLPLLHESFDCSVSDLSTELVAFQPHTVVQAVATAQPAAQAVAPVPSPAPADQRLPLRPIHRAAGPIAAFALGLLLGGSAVLQDALEPAELSELSTYVSDHKTVRDSASSAHEALNPVVDVTSLERSHLRSTKAHRYHWEIINTPSSTEPKMGDLFKSDKAASDVRDLTKRFPD
jgi:hypothetical protein